MPSKKLLLSYGVDDVAHTQHIVSLTSVMLEKDATIYTL